MTLADLLIDQWLPSDVGQIEVLGLTLDNRQLRDGEVFIAVPGGNVDGREFIDAAIQSGAVAVISEAESKEETIAWRNQVPVIPVQDLTKKVSAIAGQFFGEPSSHVQVIGVTGTNGKSTCSHLLAQLYDRLGSRAGVMGTLGYGMVNKKTHQLDELEDTGLTTADAIANQRIIAELVANGAKTITMEVSSHSLEQHRVAAVEFDSAVFTNLSRDHLDYHGTMQRYADAKSRLFREANLEHQIINWDDEYGRRLAGNSHPKAEVWTYSLEDPAAHIYAKSIEQNAHGTVAELESCWGKGVLRTSLIGRFNLSNVLAVVVACCANGYPLNAVLQAVAELHPVPGRMEQISDATDINVIVDYAHTPDSLEKALQAARQHAQGRLVCIFGCGGDRDRGKRPLMASAAEQWADKVIVTSDNPRSESPAQIIAEVRSGFSNPDAVKEIEDRGAAIAQTIRDAEAGDCIVIAGKGHEDYQQIGKDRLPFSDVKQARLALRDRTSKHHNDRLK